MWLQAAVPIIGPTAATPAYVVVNTPTPVVITTQIIDTSLLAGSVNLLKVGSTGKTLATVDVTQLPKPPAPTTQIRALSSLA